MSDPDREVAVVGGGPTGCSVGVFTAREGLDTVVFDAGTSSLRRCAYLENYPGFPAGIDVETLYDLLHEHAERAGCEIVTDHVEAVERHGAGFVLDTRDGRRVTARRVVAATRYDGEYLRPLGGDAMFETFEHHGEEEERFDRSYPDRDGTTPIEGLYVASPSRAADTQAVAAAGRGARVGRRVVADAHIDDGWWEAVTRNADDWMRREAERTGEWADRERWLEWFDTKYGDDAPVDPDSERFERVRAERVDASLSAYLDPDEIDARTRRGHRALAAHLDPEAVVEAVGDRRLLAAIDDETIRAYLDE